MGTSINMDDVFNTIMAEMKKFRKTIVDGHIKQQVMKDEIFALKSEKLINKKSWRDGI